MILEFKNGKPIRAWHNVLCANRSRPDADIRELDNESSVVKDYLVGEKAKRDISSIEEIGYKSIRLKLRGMIDELLDKEMTDDDYKVLVLQLAKFMRSQL